MTYDSGWDGMGLLSDPASCAAGSVVSGHKLLGTSTTDITNYTILNLDQNNNKLLRGINNGNENDN